jgi:hypothetical protein
LLRQPAYEGADERIVQLGLLKGNRSGSAVVFKCCLACSHTATDKIAWVNECGATTDARLLARPFGKVYELFAVHVAGDWRQIAREDRARGGFSLAFGGLQAPAVDEGESDNVSTQKHKIARIGDGPPHRLLMEIGNLEYCALYGVAPDAGFAS